jgi:DNA-binding response OmpR family regulator
MLALIVEDDKKVGGFLKRLLSEEGWSSDWVRTGEEALERAVRSSFDVVILDWMLPDLDGVTVCRELRQRGVTVPILMLTARTEVRERVAGLEAGADDYLGKPFDVEELLARVNALVRRTSGFSQWRVGALVIDRLEHRVLLNGERVELTMREYALLLHLAHNADRVVTRTKLLEQVWGTRFDTQSNVVEVHVSRLRDKLGDAAWMIETVRGQGYRLVSSK